MLYGLEKFPKRDTLHSKFMDGFTGWDIYEDYPAYHPRGAKSSYPAVNISEFDSDYRIELAAPGLCRKDYEITVNRDVLKIRSVKKFDETEKDKYARREFAQRQFEKVFILPENADVEMISASCTDGILNVHIPKKVIDTKSASKTIKVK